MARTPEQQAEHKAYCSAENRLLVLCLCQCPDCYNFSMDECLCEDCGSNNHHGHSEYHRKKDW